MVSYCKYNVQLVSGNGTLKCKVLEEQLLRTTTQKTSSITEETLITTKYHQIGE